MVTTREYKGYRVTDTGEVFGKKRFKLKPVLNKRGYYQYSLSENNVIKVIDAHRLVAILFIPNPDNKEEVNHIDGNKLNNNVWNLEWNTPMENTTHAIRTGLSNSKGSYNGMSKLTEKQVMEIRQLKGKLMHKEIAEKYGVGRTTITMILNNKLWV